MKDIAMILISVGTTIILTYYLAFVPMDNKYNDSNSRLKVEIIELQNRIAILEVRQLNLTKQICTLTVRINGLIYDYYDMPFDQAERLIDSPCLECH